MSEYIYELKVYYKYKFPKLNAFCKAKKKKKLVLAVLIIVINYKKKPVYLLIN